MCLAVPGKVLEVGEDLIASVDIGGVRRRVSLDLVPEVVAGDYVLVHVGFALQRIDEAEAVRTTRLLAEMFAQDDVPPPGGPSTP